MKDLQEPIASTWWIEALTGYVLSRIHDTLDAFDKHGPESMEFAREMLVLGASATLLSKSRPLRAQSQDERAPAVHQAVALAVEDYLDRTVETQTLSGEGESEQESTAEVDAPEEGDK